MRECLKDLLNIGAAPAGNWEHMRHSADWLIHAQKDGGIAAWYSVIGYYRAFPEVTGYIIPTLFKLSEYTRLQNHKEMALRLADWLLSIQLESGALPTIDLKNPLVFDTGQVVFGLTEAFKQSGKAEYLSGAKKAAEWVYSMQDKEGFWESFTYEKGSRSHYSRVAWALLEVYNILEPKKKELLIGARKNLDWVLTQQLDNGWFRNANFRIGENESLLHTLAYTIEGLLEGGRFFASLPHPEFQKPGKKYLSSATKAADKLISLQSVDGSLFGKYNQNWEGICYWKCLIGIAQMSVVWLKLYSLTRDIKYLEASKKANVYLKTTQNLKAKDNGVNGGLKGSQPIYGSYMPGCYISAGVKFFIDALLLEEKASNSGGRNARNYL